MTNSKRVKEIIQAYSLRAGELYAKMRACDDPKLKSILRTLYFAKEKNNGHPNSPAAPFDQVVCEPPNGRPQHSSPKVDTPIRGSFQETSNKEVK